MSDTAGMSTYQALSHRIKQLGHNKASLNNLEKRIDRHYNARLITATEFSRLDLMIFDRLAKIETGQA